MQDSILQIIEFRPEFAEHFKNINMAWIEKFFEPEPEDIKVLNDPQKHLIDTGGAILFASYKGNIVGTCALKKCSKSEFELVKMGVKETYQGLNIGLALGRSIIDRAKLLGAQQLILETNSQLKKALNLYQKLGFKVLPAEQNCSEYLRCDVKMVLNLAV